MLIKITKDMTESERLAAENTNNLYLKSLFDSLNSLDHIVEQGTSDIWTYEKRKNGKVECWCNVVARYKDVNNLVATINFPFEIFGEINAQVTKISGMAAFNTLYATTCYEAKSTQITVAANNSGQSFGTSDTIGLSVYVIGRWKK